jgi:hypothetical protein
MLVLCLIKNSFPGSWVSADHSDVIYKSIENTVFKSPFAVSIERETNAIIISIRGTLSISDLLGDLYIKEQEITWGEESNISSAITHQGIYSNAKNIYQELLQKGVFKYIQTGYPNHKIICTGHSLGGGIAALLGFLIKTMQETIFFKSKTFSICYSPPGCIISEPAIPFFSEFCTSVVLGDEILNELSNCHYRKVDILSDTLVNQIFQSHKVKFEEDELEPVKEFPVYAGLEMFLPGKVVWIVPQDSNQDSAVENDPLIVAEFKNQSYIPQLVDPRLFNHIIVSSQMFVDHLPNRVGDTLRSLKLNK